jgi:predicted Zn finger-like uncharacterized protein
VSALRGLKRDPRFVCGRCQGLRYVDRHIVLCPTCGTAVKDALLGHCKCGYDFVMRTGGGPLPTQPPAAPAPAPSAPTVPGAPPAAERVLVGKCGGCGNEFRVPESRIPEDGLRAKCAKCGHPVLVKRPETK